MFRGNRIQTSGYPKEKLYLCGNTHISSHLFPLQYLHITGDPRRRTRLTRQYLAQHSNGILRKTRHNITLHRAITNRNKSNPRRLSRQSTKQDGRTGRTHSPAATPDLSTPPWTIGCPRTHSPASSPDLCATPDNQLPRTDSLARSFTGSVCTSSPTDQTQVADRQRRHIVPDHLATAART